MLDQILGGDPGFTVCFYENYFSIVRQKDQKLIPVYYSRINRIACQDGSWPYLPEKISVFPSGIRTAARYGMISAGF